MEAAYGRGGFNREAGSKEGLPSRIVNTIASHTGPINALTFSSTPSTYILTGSSDRQIHLHRVEPSTTTTSTSPTSTPPLTTQPIQRYLAHGYPLLSLTCSLSNETFASSGGDRTGPFLWDVSTAQTLRRFGSNSPQTHTSRIPCVIFAGADDSLLISGSDDRSVRFWDVKSRDSRPIMIWEEARDGITCLSLAGERGSGRGQPWEVLTGSVDSRLRSYDIRMGKITTDVMTAPIVSLDVSKDGQAVLVGCMDSRLRLFDRAQGTLLQSFGGGGGGGDGGFKNTSVRLKSVFSADESIVAVGSEDDGRVRGWDVLTGESVGGVNTAAVNIEAGGEGKEGKCVSALAFRKKGASGGEVMAAGGVDGIVRIYGR